MQGVCRSQIIHILQLWFQKKIKIKIKNKLNNLRAWYFDPNRTLIMNLSEGTAGWLELKDYFIPKYKVAYMLITHTLSGVTVGGAGGQSLTFFTGKFLLTYQKKREARNKEKMEKEKGKSKRECGKLKMKGESYKMSTGPFFFFFFFFTFHFSKPLKFVLGLPKWGIFYREKAFHARKKNQEKWLCPSENLHVHVSICS